MLKFSRTIGSKLKKFLSDGWLAVFVASCSLLILAQFAFLGQQLDHPIPIQSTLDFSWMSDLLERWMRGQVAGRDFIFTYGPAYQLIFSLPMVLFNVPSYQSVLYASVIAVALSSVLVYLMISLVFRQSHERTFHGLVILTVFGVAVIPAAGALKFLPLMAYAAILGSLVGQHRSASWVAKVTLASLPSLLGLYVFDLFGYGLLVSLAAVPLAVLIGRWKLKSVANWLGLVLLWQVVISIILSGGLDYLRYSLDTVKDYQFVMNINWTLHSKVPLLALPALVFSLLWLIRTNQVSRSATPILISVAALLYWKSAITRSDDSHLLLSIVPSILATYVNLSLLAKRQHLAIVFLPLLLLISPFRANYSSLIPAKVVEGVRSLWTRPDFSTLYSLAASHSGYTNEDLELIRDYVRNNRGQVLIYPYDSFLLNREGEALDTYVVQWYQTAGSITEKRAVEDLSQHPPRYIIYGIDNAAVFPVDDIPNSSRNKLFFNWVRYNYRIAEQNDRLLILEYQSGKVLEPTDLCLAYEISFSPTVSFAESLINLLKPPIYSYHEGDILLRLPVKPGERNYVIYQQSDTASGLQRLLNFRSDLTVNPASRQIVISEYSPLTKRSKLYSPPDLLIKCVP